MRLAIADPPYLGRADRWYGRGRGSAGGRGRADSHPDARRWDDPDTHRALIRQLVADFDGWAVAAAPDSLPVYLEVVPAGTRVMVWHRGNAAPSGARVASQWEPVLLHIPASRIPHGTGLAVSDVLHAGIQGVGFAGAKPPQWTRWVLDALGFRPGEDTVTDLFPGSGAVAAAVDGMLELHTPPGSYPQV